jgi:hypothetical protein
MSTPRDAAEENGNTPWSYVDKFIFGLMSLQPGPVGTARHLF